MHNHSDFVKEAGRQNLEISPLSGEEVAEIVAEAYRLSPALVARYVEILSVRQ
jgi:hypothetical protein